MPRARIDVRELDTSAAFGARIDGAVPMVVRVHAPLMAAGVQTAPMTAGVPFAPVAGSVRSASDLPEARPPRSWLALGARLVRDAAIAVAWMTLLPIGL